MAIRYGVPTHLRRQQAPARLIRPPAATGTAHTQNIDDGIGATDALAKTATHPLADAAALTDAAAKTVAHPLADGAGVTDAAARAVSRVQADAAALTDATAKTVGHALADPAGLTDAAVRAAIKALADTGVLTDSANTGGATAHTRNIDDGLSATDATAKSSAHPIADTAALTDVRAKSATHPVPDGIAGTDALNRAWVARLTQSDTAALTDQVNTGGSISHTLTIADAAALTDLFSVNDVALRLRITGRDTKAVLTVGNDYPADRESGADQLMVAISGKEY